MQTKTINLYEYSELSPKAKEKALSAWRVQSWDSYSLQVDLDNHIEGLLADRGIAPLADVKGYATTHAKIYFSLSHSQGDGVMFEGTFEWGKYTVYITHKGRYYHSHSAQIEVQESHNLGFHMDDDHKDVKKFEKMYHAICADDEEIKTYE